MAALVVSKGKERSKKFGQKILKICIWDVQKEKRFVERPPLIREHFKKFRQKILQFHYNVFATRGKYNGDVRWCNIGKYRNKEGNTVIVVFDLQGVVDYDPKIHNNWIDVAMTLLFAHKI